MQVGFMKALGELFILKSTKPLPIIFKSLNTEVPSGDLLMLSFTHLMMLTLL